MGNIDKNILRNIYQSSKIGLESAQYLYGKVVDRQLKSELNSCVKRYTQILNQTEKTMQKMFNNTTSSIVTKNQFLWNGVDNINTNTDKQKIVNLLILGSKSGIDNVITYSNNDMVNDSVKQIANSYINCEKENIQNILKYINKEDEM